MCLYEKYILNPKFKPNSKNNYNPPVCEDKRQQYIIMKCGRCKECLEDRAKMWKTRIYCENKYMDKGTHCYYITMTFDQETLDLLQSRERGTDPYNSIAAKTVKKFCDNWKYHLKETCRHFIIPELGHENTERLHLHGIIWTKCELPDNLNDRNTFVQSTIWKNGWVKFEEIKNIDKCTNYIVKYVTKVDRQHLDFTPKILVSRGLGKKYAEKVVNKDIHKFQGNNTINYITLPNGQKTMMPDYYKKKLWSDEERETMWMDNYDKMIKRKGQIVFDMTKPDQRDKYWRYVKQKRKDAIKLGYKTPEYVNKSKQYINPSTQFE